MNKHKPVAVILLLSVIWGSTWMGIKVGLEYFPPILCAGIRFLSAFAVLLLWIWIQKKSFRFPYQEWGVMMYLGLQQAVIYGLVFWGEQYIDSGISAVLFSTMPFFVMLFSLLMIARTNLYLTQLIGILLSISGTVLIYDPDMTLQPDFGKGFAAILLSAVISSYMAVYIKRYAQHIPAIQNTTVQMGVAAGLLLAIGLMSESFSDIRWTWEGVLAVLYLGVIGSACAFALYMWVIKKVTPLSASVIPLLTPIVALLIGGLILHERFTLPMIYGSALVLIGILFISMEWGLLIPASHDSADNSDSDTNKKIQ